MRVQNRCCETVLRGCGRSRDSTGKGDYELLLTRTGKDTLAQGGHLREPFTSKAWILKDPNMVVLRKLGDESAAAIYVFDQLCSQTHVEVMYPS